MNELEGRCDLFMLCTWLKPFAFKTNVLKPSFVKAVVLNEVLCNFIINS